MLVVSAVTIFVFVMFEEGSKAHVLRNGKCEDEVSLRGGIAGKWKFKDTIEIIRLSCNVQRLASRALVVKLFTFPSYAADFI